MMTLQELHERGVGRAISGDPSVCVGGVRHDSRGVLPGELFVAIRGAESDGARFIPSAIERGATAVMCEQPVPELDVPVLVTDHARRDLALASSLVYGEPTHSLSVIGLTGTNGKTTTAWLIDDGLRATGAVTSVMGTVALRGPGINRVPAYTTPEGDEIARFAAEVRDAGATHLVMEVSSHALTLHRADGVKYAVAAFTNLTQDHLDFHGDLEAYGEAKARLFLELSPKVSVVNVDDTFGATLTQRIRARGGRVITCSARAGSGADVQPFRVHMDETGTVVEFDTPDGMVAIRSALVGQHNIENLSLAMGCAVALELPLTDFARGLSRSIGAPGRLERVPHPGGVSVFVDYAHTPDALKNALAAVRPIARGRVIVVFGCGGDRDPHKRPMMGEAAARGADLCVVTTDNPRGERPSAIIAAIEPGVRAAGLPLRAALSGVETGYQVIEDRRRAIQEAIAVARDGDVLLIAGKGHEDYQIVNGEKHHFDDREVAASAIARLEMS